MSNTVSILRAASTILLAALLMGCAGSADAPRADLSSMPAPVEKSQPALDGLTAGTPAADPGFALPRPSELAVQPRAVSNGQPYSLYGTEFMAGSENLVTPQENALLFQSNWGNDAVSGLDDAAYAIYAFDLTDISNASTLRFSSPQPFHDSLWFGLSDWESDRWEWREPSDFLSIAGQIPLGTDPPFIDAEGRLLVAVVTASPADFLLNRLYFQGYDEVENNDTLQTANPLPGVNVAGFSGSIGSGEGYPGYDGDLDDWFMLQGLEDDYSGRSIVLQFETDTADLSLGLTDSEGEVVRALSSEGQPTQDTFFLDIGSLDNEFGEFTLPLYIHVQAQSGFSDYILSAVQGNKPIAHFSADPPEGSGPLTVNFDASSSQDPDHDIVEYRWDFNSDFSSDHVSSQPDAQWTFETDGFHRVDLSVRDSLGFFGSYTFYVVVGTNPFDERENNDSMEEANELNMADPDGWTGSLGGDFLGPYAEYDGDGTDWFSFPLDEGKSIIFTVEELLAHGNVSLSILDGNGDELASTFQDQNTVQYDYNAADAQPFYLEAYGATSYENYSITWEIGEAPVIEITANPPGGFWPITIEFTATTVGGDGQNLVYDWNMQGTQELEIEDGQAVEQWEYTETGDYHVVCIATDDRGLSGYAELLVEVRTGP